MKSLSFVLVGLLLAAPCMAVYTPEQNTTLEGMRLSFQLGTAYQQAQNGQNIASYNSLIDQYNAWVIEHFGNDANLLIRPFCCWTKKHFVVGKRDIGSTRN